MHPTPLSALLRPPRTPGPEAGSALLRPDDVGGPGAWSALVRDGVLRRVREDVAVPAAVPLTAALRAASLARAVPPRTVVIGPTAAWVHVGGEAPARLDLGHQPGTHRPEVWAWTDVRSEPGLVADSAPVGGVLVTTPERTAVDVALREPEGTALHLVLALAAAGADLDRALRALEVRTRLVGRPRARRLLAEARGRLAGVA
ncbi:hypothetical protein DNL40_10170 [Xylanimonas oleitrophica]|uniref:AbiEi antitoxin C-terminal domain-containing protein n=1 Tax=Xylanimonas oleitrophica TaxID=2607479 RepID=A0A2W5WP32_9MICO|nr:hypothetical protein [Xylanimonas oleitrophica]PZR52732.1 hypothetical protein DNL40_10170 [Xylanimonas oleitrophica]